MAKDKLDGYVPTPKLRKLGLLPPLTGRWPGDTATTHSRLIGRFDDSRGRHYCWPWLAGKDKDGYGIVGGKLRAHRLAWEASNGRKLLPGEVVRHTCDNPTCCNPRHLVIGTDQHNTDDRVARDRSAVGAKNGRNKLTGDQVLTIARSQTPARQVARELGIDESTVRGIRSGQTWGWLTHIPKMESKSKKTKGASENAP